MRLHTCSCDPMQIHPAIYCRTDGGNLFSFRSGQSERTIVFRFLTDFSAKIKHYFGESADYQPIGRDIDIIPLPDEGKSEKEALSRPQSSDLSQSILVVFNNLAITGCGPLECRFFHLVLFLAKVDGSAKQVNASSRRRVCIIKKAGH